MDLVTVLWIECVVLILGTAYAWYNWYLVLRGRCGISCIPGVAQENPYTSKCFWGALFFTLALLVNIWSLAVAM
ncbi:MAG: hypothetical protein KBD19_04505 [Candidatus Moranbacteria bacterium]|nr:hypothetical protein [Candidatus Moranbacteria bacterium]